MQRMSATVATLVLCLAHLACGRTDGSSKPDSAVGSVCTALCGYAARCNLAGSCETDCSTKGLTDDQAVHWKPEFIAAVTACLGQLDCSNDTICFEQALAQIEPGYQSAPDVQRCLQKRSSCTPSWADDLCYSMAALVPADRAASDACSSTADCSDFKKCMAPYGGFYY
jgi:hypothetical protein